MLWITDGYTHRYDVLNKRNFTDSLDMWSKHTGFSDADTKNAQMNSDGRDIKSKKSIYFNSCQAKQQPTNLHVQSWTFRSHILTLVSATGMFRSVQEPRVLFDLTWR